MYKRNGGAIHNQSGFTLAEMMIAISIITILVIASTMAGLNAIKHAQALEAAHQLQEVHDAVKVYFADTHSFPRTNTITNAADPAENGLLTEHPGVTGWNGPYIRDNLHTHRWGGAIRWVNEESPGFELDGESIDNFFIYLEEDRTGTHPLDDQAPIPVDILVRIDKILDDGDLATGEVRGNGLQGTCAATGVDTDTFTAVCNEIILRIERAGL